MQSIRADLSRNLKSIEIHTFADLHIGDKYCDMKLVKSRIDYVKNTKNAYCILNGDLLNSAIKTSVSDCYSEQLTPMEQIQTGVDLFGDIADKILYITTGNHEARYYRTDGIDITKLIAKQLQIDDRYSNSGALLFIRFGEQSRGHKETNGSGKVRKVCYTIYSLHGSGGGRKEGAKAIRLADMASIVDADIYIHSHTHLSMIMKQDFFRVDIPNSTAKQVTKLFVNTAATLGYAGYAQTFEFKPSSTDNPIIYLSGERKEFTARL